MPRDIAVFEALIPTAVLLFFLGAALTWILDSALARIGVYRFVWHVSLFRVSLLVVVCCALGLVVYR
ncbi:DUF1656 domain-containing protein [Paraburkholderia unamae]|uniref:Uncharacterized protein DUF1656 n=1 Tax=Paraburkholderia unamae TaxID=219649 RepID=A0ABX5KAQ1_9BURK|nr:DUF1656 domain-containing protein [Paraburkholderia unamae]PVX70629.1 uncharacterized protein DUF1656 [Paraburkholderia unamae]RAR62331.1 uncharacterized protein DUF1656 [Paraburkholderia unamae]CAG9245624.1 putative Protein AaeX [Paraburkholderia unamae]